MYLEQSQTHCNCYLSVTFFFISFNVSSGFTIEVIKYVSITKNPLLWKRISNVIKNLENLVDLSETCQWIYSCKRARPAVDSPGSVFSAWKRASLYNCDIYPQGARTVTLVIILYFQNKYQSHDINPGTVHAMSSWL